MKGQIDPTIRAWLDANGFKTIDDVVALASVSRFVVQKRILAGRSRENVLGPPDTVRLNAIAYALGTSNIYAGHLCRRAGIDWKTASKAEIEALAVKRGARRSHKWLEQITGYCAQHAVEVLRAAGLDWRTASQAKIKRAIVANLEADRRRRKRSTVVRTKSKRRSPLPSSTLLRVGDLALTASEWALRLGVDRTSVYAWHAEGLLARHAARIENGKYERRATRGRRVRLYEADGLALTVDEWAKRLDLTRKGLWVAAKKARHSIGDEIALRVARRAELEAKAVAA